MRAERFAPIGSFELLEDPTQSGVIRGIASPGLGPTPCALALVSGETTVATGAAIGFSEDAAERGIRLGWCAFEMGGVPQAMALGQDVELRCMVSGEVQMRWEGKALAASLMPARQKYLSFVDLRKALREFNACSDWQQVMPFAAYLARTGGSRAVFRASYRYFLERPPEPAVEAESSGDYTTVQAILDLWRTLRSSAEHQSLAKPFLPGPFDPRFPFPLDALDDAD